LHIPHQFQQTLAIDQLDVLALGELSRITREFANANDPDSVGAMVRDKAPHFANGGHVDLPRPPLLALNKFDAAVFAQDQVDAAIRAAQASFFNLISAAAEGFANQHFEFAPAHRRDAVEAGLRIKQNFPMPGFEKRGAGTNPADEQSEPGKWRVRTIGQRLPQALQQRTAVR
jgi:hypothetical protein